MICNRNIISLVMGIFLLANQSMAQDLNCRVEILSPQIQSSEKNRVFENLKKDITYFMNNRKWSEDRLQSQERIECNMILNITQWDRSGKYQATAQVQSTRPVFGSSFSTTVLNLNDKQWSFTYVEGEPLDYSENGLNKELPSLLAYYANLIVGMDYDTFSLQGGTPFFLKAQGVVSQSQTSVSTGWRAYDDLRNRYWIIENLLSPEMAAFRQGTYIYHRKGLDQLSKNSDKGRTEIASIFSSMKESVAAKPNSMLAQLFFLSKADEIVSIFQRSADTQEKASVSAALQDIDPSNSSKYQQIQQ